MSTLVSGTPTDADDPQGPAAPADEGSDHRPHLGRGVWGAVLLVPVIGFTLFGATGRDDNYISYHAAESLARTGEILNYNGDRIEQSSSLLHTVLLGLAAWVTPFSVPVLGVLVGVVAACGAVVVAASLARHFDPDAAVPAAIFCALGAPLLYWTFGGLETSLAALVIAWVVYTGGRFLSVEEGPLATALPPAAIAIALYAAVRPEGWLIVIAAMGATSVTAAVLYEGSRRRALLLRAGVLVGVAVASAGLLAAFRLWYFDQPVPQPVEAKAATPDVRALLDGAEYLNASIGSLGVAALLVLGAYGGLHRMIRRDPTALLALAVLAAGAGFIVTSGGDWMEAGRFVAPFIPVMAALAAVGIRMLAIPRSMTALVALALFGGVIAIAQEESSGTPIWTSPIWAEEPEREGSWSWVETRNKVHLRDIPTVEAMNRLIPQLHTVLGRPVEVSSGQAGMVAYHTVNSNLGTVRFIDQNNLASDEFADCPELLGEPTNMGTPVRLGPWARGEPVCGRPAPDVLFGLRELPQQWSRTYTSIFQTRGTVQGSRTLGGGRTAAAQWIAVRNDLLPQIEGFEPSS